MAQILVELISIDKFYAVTDTDGKEYTVYIMHDENTCSDSYEITRIDGEDVSDNIQARIYKAVSKSKK